MNGTKRPVSFLFVLSLLLATTALVSRAEERQSSINTVASLADPNRSSETDDDSEWVVRTVSFRDGTLLRLELKNIPVNWKTISRSGQISERTILMADIESLEMVLEPITKEVSELRAIIAKLGSTNFLERKLAHQKLSEIGESYRDIISAAEKTANAEIKWRIREILKLIPPSSTSIANDFDRITLSSAPKELIDGDAGDFRCPARYRGVEFMIEREQVLSLSQDPVTLDFDGESTVAEVEKISTPNPANFPSNMLLLNFEVGPAGELLVDEQDLTDVYVPLGVRITTNIEGSYIAVQDYPIQANLKYSAANLAPPYQGETTLRFCVPGNPKLSAGVTHIGCWLSYISPRGTQLQAFDSRGELIGMVETSVSGAEYLALRSTIPIAYCRIVPIEEIDSDYAFDNFTFDLPKPLTESGDPNFHSVVTTSGERIQALRLKTINDESLALQETSIGVEEFIIPKSDIAVLVSKTDGQLNEDDRLFAQLKDGSIVRTLPSKGELILARSPSEQTIAREDLAAIWSQGAEIRRPSNAENLTEGNAVVILPDGETTAPKASLGATWIESEQLPPQFEYSYSDSPVVWFQMPTRRTPLMGALRTNLGEDYTLGPENFNLEDWDSTRIVLSRNGEEVTILMKEVKSFRLPQSE